MEARGYQYEGADASLELLVRRSLPGYRHALQPGRLLGRRAPPRPRRRRCRAQGDAGRGDGQGARLRPRRRRRPGHPDRRRRQRPRQRPRRRRAQGPGRVLPGDHRHPPGRLQGAHHRLRRPAPAPPCACSSSAATSEHTWQTVGASTDIIEASWLALADAYEWWLLRHPASDSQGVRMGTPWS